LPNEPRWLPIEVVVEINRTVVTMTGERHLLRDPGLLDSAMARPQNAFAYGDEVIALVEHRSTEDDFVRVIRPFVLPR
jgi:prophage maintenance system killer protein